MSHQTPSDDPREQERLRKLKAHKDKIKKVGDIYREKKRKADQEHVKKILLESRPKEEDIRISHIGKLRMRIHYYPSFEKNIIWDIREENIDEKINYNLYMNTLLSRHVIQPGYDIVAIPSDRLKMVVDRISTYSVPFDFHEPKTLGLDGVKYGVTVYSGFLTKKHLEWWENLDDSPIGLSHFVREVVLNFLPLPTKPFVI